MYHPPWFLIALTLRSCLRQSLSNLFRVWPRVLSPHPVFLQSARLQSFKIRMPLVHILVLKHWRMVSMPSSFAALRLLIEASCQPHCNLAEHYPHANIIKEDHFMGFQAIPETSREIEFRLRLSVFQKRQYCLCVNYIQNLTASQVRCYRRSRQRAVKDGPELHLHSIRENPALTVGHRLSGNYLSMR